MLDEYGRGGLYDNWDTTDAERAVLESRENPAWNRSGLIAQMEFHGSVQGRLLQDYGMPGVADELRDYRIDAYVIGSHVIKANLSPSPRARHPYYITSFEKTPGTPIGNGLVDMIADLQDVANAALRSLVNNLSISSGPQVVVNDDRLAPEENGEELYPWRRWHVRNDPVGNNAKPPIEFFQPQSNSQDLLTVFKAFVDLSDDVSAIPKYIGGQPGGGAGRTASGLSDADGQCDENPANCGRQYRPRCIRSSVVTVGRFNSAQRLDWPSHRRRRCFSSRRGRRHPARNTTSTTA